MAPFPLLNRLDRLGTVFAAFLTVFIIFYERLGPFTQPFFHLKLTITDRYFIVLDHFMIKNVEWCHNVENGVSTVKTNLGRSSNVPWTNLQRSSDVPWTFVGRILDGGRTNLGRWSDESWTGWSRDGHGMDTEWSPGGHGHVKKTKDSL